MATRVEGVERLRRRFAAVPATVKRAAKDALQKSANELVAMQKRLVPVALVAGGTLRDSIRAEELDAPLIGYAVKAGNEKAFYAAMVEFGTAKTPAQPYFLGPYRASRKRIASRTNRAIRNAIKAGR